MAQNWGSIPIAILRLNAEPAEARLCRFKSKHYEATDKKKRKKKGARGNDDEWETSERNLLGVGLVDGVDAGLRRDPLVRRKVVILLAALHYSSSALRFLSLSRSRADGGGEEMLSSRDSVRAESNRCRRSTRLSWPSTGERLALMTNCAGLPHRDGWRRREIRRPILNLRCPLKLVGRLPNQWAVVSVPWHSPLSQHIKLLL